MTIAFPVKLMIDNNAARRPDDSVFGLLESAGEGRGIGVDKACATVKTLALFRRPGAAGLVCRP